MMRQRATSAVLTGAGLFLVSCGPTNDTVTTPAGSATSTATNAGHVCKPKPLPYPPPAPALTFMTVGHPGNEWAVLVAPGAMPLHFQITQRPGSAVSRAWFTVSPADGPNPGHEVRTFPPFAADWAPGEHSATMTWDGTDDRGKQVPPGFYQLSAQADSTTPLTVACADDSGQGVEYITGREGAGLGRLDVPKVTAIER